MLQEEHHPDTEGEMTEDHRKANRFPSLASGASGMLRVLILILPPAARMLVDGGSFPFRGCVVKRNDCFTVSFLINWRMVVEQEQQRQQHWGKLLAFCRESGWMA